MVQRSFGLCLLLASLVAGCGGSDSSDDDATTGGSGGAGGSTLGTGGLGGSSQTQAGTTSSSTGGSDVTAGCATWPKEKLFPYVGPFFYGPDPGPCSSTLNGEVTEFTYGEGSRLISATLPAQGMTYTYAYEEGLLTLETHTSSSGVPYDVTYVYAGNQAGYSQADPSDSTRLRSATYTLDAQGYPVSVRYVDSASDVTSSGIATFYTYEYEDCRIVTRRGYNSANAEVASALQIYSYDSEGHLVSRKSEDYDEVFDYSCW